MTRFERKNRTDINYKGCGGINDALDDMIPADKLGYYMTTRTIEIAPLAYMRGRTLDNAFIILDEAHCLGQYPQPSERTKELKQKPSNNL